MNSNYAIDNGLKPSKDAIVMEGKSSPFANIIAVQEGHKKEVPRIIKSYAIERN